MMRIWWMAAAVTAGMTLAMPAVAQRVWQNGRWVQLPPRSAPAPIVAPQRWGGRIDGRWYGGAQAPGGWAAYRRPSRGWRLPRYWMAPSFVVGDYLTWGLAAPPYGYYWVRYYDDAVLVDHDGRVWDSVGGVAWDGDTQAYSQGYSSSSVTTSGYGAGYPMPGQTMPPPPPPAYPDAGAPIPLPSPMGAAPATRGGSAPPPVIYAPPAAHVQPIPPSGAAVCVTNCPGVAYGGGSYYSGGSYSSGGVTYYTAPGVTTVVVQGAPTTTTTTVTETVEERSAAGYKTVRRAPRRVYRKSKSKIVRRCTCACAPDCR